MFCCADGFVADAVSDGDDFADSDDFPDGWFLANSDIEGGAEQAETFCERKGAAQTGHNHQHQHRNHQKQYHNHHNHYQDHNLISHLGGRCWQGATSKILTNKIFRF